MISFDLKCEKNHVFEAWFRSSSAYDDQRARGLISCPECGSMDITKAVMAPNVGAKSNQKAGVKRDDNKPDLADSKPAQAVSTKPQRTPAASNAPLPDAVRSKMVQYVKALKAEVEKTCDNVGKDFPEEARKIHYGDVEERGIYGEASADEVRDLLDEGIDLLPLPDIDKDLQ